MTAFRHLDYPDACDPRELGPAALDDLLEHGDLDDWAPIVDAIRSDPFGALADTVLKLCAAHPMYGTSALWTTWIERVRARPRPMAMRELRKRSGLTQADVAERTGSSQSDVSKLEHRDDVRLSTLREYVRALGGRLALIVETPSTRASLLIDERSTR